jgi:prepilin-type N-terminal cleavage/methylation domain-containing protein
MREAKRQEGWTLIEILMVCVIIGMIAAFAVPSFMHTRRIAYEDNAIARLQRIAHAETRYYSEYGRFGNFAELVTANFLPKGYSTVYRFTDPMDEFSLLPFIDRYSLALIVPDSPNSLYYKVDAVPVGYNRMGLRTFNINLFLTGTNNVDNILQVPPVREGLATDSPIVQDY